MKFTLILFLTIIFFSSIELKAQDEILLMPYDTTGECDIYMQNRVLIKNAELFGVTDSTVFILKSDITKELRAADMRTIKFNGKNGFWTGAAIGAGIEAGTFLFLAAIYGKDGGAIYALAYGLVGLVPSALIGGFIGLIAEEDKVYNLPKDDLKYKIRMIRKIIKDNS